MIQDKKSTSILIAALGGEGGGTLTDWIAEAARLSGMRVQCTSIPGVAQRTGATTYYIELAHKDSTQALALTPMPGMVDLVIASELIEAARVLQSGYITPNRTSLITSEHRVFSTSEKSDISDGRYDVVRAANAVRALAKTCIMFDMDQAVSVTKSAISSIMFGALAGSGLLPINRSVFEKVIETSGFSVKANLSGFSHAYYLAGGAKQEPSHRHSALPLSLTSSELDVEALIKQAHQMFSANTHLFIEEGIRRLTVYQNISYAKLYLERLQFLLPTSSNNSTELNNELLPETARYLALRMSFDDLIKVAYLKTRRTRFERVYKEASVEPGSVVIITEYFKPGLEEFCGFLAPSIAEPIIRWAKRREILEKFNFGLHLKTSSISGFSLLWLVSKLKIIRRFGYRYAVEQESIEEWLNLIDLTRKISYNFALEVALSARIIKGYSGTYRESLGDFDRLMNHVVKPAIATNSDASSALRDGVNQCLKKNHAKEEIMSGNLQPISFYDKNLLKKS
jgi:indolepyruvate ferredoxin oxidoreductase beta subunit